MISLIPVIPSVVTLLSAAGLYFLGKRRLDEAVTVITTRVDSTGEEQKTIARELFFDTVTCSNEHHDSIAGKVADVKKSFDESADRLDAKAEELKSHARQVLDTGTSQSASAAGYIERVICPQCQRVVYKFERHDDGTVKQCLDCKHRSS